MAAALRLRRRRQAPARVWLQFLGYLASLVDVLPDCRLHMRPLQLHLLRHYHPSVDSLTWLVPRPAACFSCSGAYECPAPDCVAIIRKAGTQVGLSDRAAALVASSRRESTCESYNSRLAGFFQWCNSHGVDPRTASISQIADFLITLFDKGRLISTIRGYRSAIAAIHKGFDDGICVCPRPRAWAT